MIEKYDVEFEYALKRAINSEFVGTRTDKELYNAMEYALFSGGKRVRPKLAFLSGELNGVPYDKVLPFALSIEFIHTYSLIHDDLPSMDNDDYRRGKYTVHKKFGENTAILAGDALLNLAYENLFHNVKNEKELKAARIVAASAGATGMVGGQATEFSLKTQKDINESDVLNYYSQKTGMLIWASICCPYYLSDSKVMEEADIKKIASNIGLIFQLVDDILDKDKEGEFSFLTLFGEERTRQLLNYTDSENERIFQKYSQSDCALLSYTRKLKERNF